MPIKSITTDVAGQINVNPRSVKIQCDDDLAAILTPGYIHQNYTQTFAILPTDLVEVSYINNQIVFCTPVIQENLVTLQILNNSLMTIYATVTAEQLANDNTVIILPSYGTQQFVIWNMCIGPDCIDFDAGGDRDIIVTDGETVYTSVSPTNLKNISDTSIAKFWASDTTLRLPLPGSPIKPTFPGASLKFFYGDDGSIDYASGSLTIGFQIARFA